MLAALTREAVLAAIDECDRSGREAFLAWHGFGPSTVYSLEYRGRRYPSKAVAGVALGLEAASFSGGAEHSARALVRLGFRVRRGGRLLTRHDVDLPRRVSLREQVDPLASALAFRRAGSGRVAVGIDVGRGDRTTVVVAELRPDGTCRVLDVSTREAP